MRALDHVIVVDTETGGLDPLHHSLLSVGLVSGDGTRTLEFYVLEPTLTTDERSMAVNRIDLDRVRAEGLSPEKAVDRIEAFLDGIGRGRPLKAAGHNVAFDIAFLRRLYRMAGRDFPPDFAHPTIDTHTQLWEQARAVRAQAARRRRRERRQPRRVSCQRRLHRLAARPRGRQQRACRRSQRLVLRLRTARHDRTKASQAGRAPTRRKPPTGKRLWARRGRGGSSAAGRPGGAGSSGRRRWCMAWSR